MISNNNPEDSKDFQKAHGLCEALVGMLMQQPPRVSALAMGSTLTELARHPSTGPLFVQALQLVGGALGWEISQRPLSVPEIDEALLLERRARDGNGALTEQVELAGMPIARLTGIAFDLDGTLRRCTVPNQPCPNDTGEFEILPGVQAFFRWLRGHRPEMKLGYASNQGSVALGHLTEEQAGLIAYTTMVVATGSSDFHNGGVICTSNDPTDPFRKPNPGMLNQLAAAWEMHPATLLYVGDWETDRQAALAAGWWYLDGRQLFPRWA